MKAVIFVTLFALIGLVQPTYIPEDDKSLEIPIACEACVAFAKIIEGLVEKEVPKETVEKEAEKLCELLSGSLKQFCEDHLVSVVDVIYDAISKSSPLLVCTALQFCL
ncbi:uncharacterized protein LOC126885233 [Diabrotica virgifera virgifera]|uniref:Saposin B-type domain-containing protein n=1 Tax=Diabrotica virgifera virgifera TaxID=50390 RepID=A0ABM5KBU2_DIAVI|nr:uncharacterized protein LOC126885233 [Diabrotica virgifera virgifera]